MTEREAKTKLCPLKLLNGYHESMAQCITSECMMWRWDDWQKLSKYGYIHETGYCGLAGKI